MIEHDFFGFDNALPDSDMIQNNNDKQYIMIDNV